MTVCQRSCLGVLSLRANGTACPDRVVTLCLNYLEEGVRYKRAWSDLKPQLAPLFLGVLFPLLCFSERDQKQVTLTLTLTCGFRSDQARL